MHLATTATDGIRPLLGGALGIFRLERIERVIDFALDIFRDGLARRLCSFEG